MTEVSSVAFFKPIWFCWSVMGVRKSENIRYQGVYTVYRVLIFLFVIILFPMNLCLALFSSPTIALNIKNFNISVTITACCLKFIFFAYKRPKIELAESILQQLDERVKSFEEQDYFRMKMARRICHFLNLNVGIYVLVGITAEVVFLLQTERELLHPAWFPFDWRTSTRNYVFTNIYQFFSSIFCLIMNYAGDCYPPLALCFLSGHIRLLGFRVSKIGHQKWSTFKRNEEALRDCIIDQKKLYSLFYVVEDIISLPMFLQIVCSTLNVCTTVAALLFYANSFAERSHYVLYSSCLILKIFPCCYYGTEVGLMFEGLHRAAYDSNWLKQTLRYKKNMLLFTERSLKPTTPLAAKMIQLHLTTFFAVCRIAYSIFAVIMRMRD